MDKQSWIDHWTQLHESLFFYGPPSAMGREAPTDRHFDRIEGRFKFKLPLSFRTFSSIFGPGRLARSFVFFAPGYQKAGLVDFVGNNKWQSYESSLRPDADRVKGLFAFGAFLDDYIVWDTASPVGSNDELEYPIFKMPKLHSHPLLHITDTFAEYVEDCCLAGRFWRLLGEAADRTWTDEQGIVRPVECFEPIGERVSSQI